MRRPRASSAELLQRHIENGTSRPVPSRPVPSRPVPSRPVPSRPNPYSEAAFKTLKY